MARAVEIALTGADQAVVTGGVQYLGVALRETAAAVAVVRIYDNTAASGNLIDTISLAASESVSLWYGEDGISCDNGIYVDVVSGAVEGSVRVG